MDHSANDNGEPSAFSSIWEYFFSQDQPLSTQFVQQDNGPNESTGLLAETRNRNLIRVDDGVVVETADIIRRGQEQLDVELSEISVKPAFNYTARTSRRYVQSLRLVFLRSEKFDAKKAALRLVTFFENKLALFGSETLVRPIRLSDLTYEDTLSLKSGCIQVLQSPDKFGRSVLFYSPRFHVYRFHLMLQQVQG